MAIIWKVKDGEGKDKTDEGTKIDIDELTSRLKKYSCQYLSKTPPTFNGEASTEYYRHIVIKITDKDILNDIFDTVGFYVVKDLDPSQSGFLYG